MAYDMVIKGAKAVTPDGVIEADIVVQNGVIAEIGSDIEASGTEIIQADGKYVFPGVIDCHVHFNEPGREDWEGFETGSQMMAAGGCTTYFDMPLNCIPSTVTAEHLLAKAELGRQNLPWILRYGAALCQAISRTSVRWLKRERSGLKRFYQSQALMSSALLMNGHCSKAWQKSRLQETSRSPRGKRRDHKLLADGFGQ